MKRGPAVVSVIVPAYNQAPYIGRCIESLLAQTVPLEIIVVNDGSTDETSERVRAIRHDTQHSIVLLEQANRGLSVTRNVGMNRASGVYIGLVDGDDWVEPEMYSTLSQAASASGADLVICGGEMVDHVTAATKPFHDHHRFADLAARTKGSFAGRSEPDAFRLDTSACKRLYRRAWLEGLGFRFAEGLLFEDVLAHYQLLMAPGRILLLNRSFYRYRINHPGRITDSRDERVLTIFEILLGSIDALRHNHASSEVWASFIWFQTWVMQWLGSQVDPSLRAEFSRGAVGVARLFPQGGIREFQRRFHDDQHAQMVLTLQVLGFRNTLMHLAANVLDDQDRRMLDRAAEFRPFASIFGRRF